MTFTTPSPSDPNGESIDNNFEEQEKCEHCHMSLNVRNPSGFCDHLYFPDNCDICKKAPSPHQEAWAEHDWYATIREIAKASGYEPNDYFENQMEKAIRHGIKEALTTLHKADCERFREMIGEDEKIHKFTDGQVSFTGLRSEGANYIRAELRTALSKMEEEKVSKTLIN